MTENFSLETFLQLPTDIRKHVYYHLDGSLMSIAPNGYDEIEFLTKAERKRRKKLLKYMFPVFKPYMELFKSDSEFIYKWLEMALWLRYDSIVLDCLRLNQLYEGTLLGSIDLITLDGHLQLGLFDKKKHFLQVWYSKKDYQKLIMDQYFAYDKYKADSDCDFIRFNLDILSETMSTTTLTNLLRKQYLSFISQLWFGEDEAKALKEEGVIMVQDGNDDYNDDTGSTSEDTDDNTLATNIKRRKLTTTPTIKKKTTLSPHIQMTVNNMKSMKNLQIVSCRGDRLFKHLINGHGLTNRNVKSIPSTIKKKIPKLELYQLSNISRKNVVDVTLWENLRSVTLNNIETIDMNMLIIPPSCASLTIKHVSECKWWDFKPSIDRICGNDIKTIDTSTRNSLPKLEIIDEKKMDPKLIYECQRVFWKNLPELKEIIFYNILKFNNKYPIIMPRTLYTNKRVRFNSCGEINNIILL